MNNGNKPAHPTGHSQSGTGLTKREHFAAMAMQGMLSNSEIMNHHNGFPSAKDAVGIADALLKELDK
jgi:hypothetical protein